MKVEEITVRIRRFKEIAKSTSDANIYNTCMNRLSVLEVMLNRFLYHDWYDEESDYRTAYVNTVEEMVEVMNN